MKEENQDGSYSPHGGIKKWLVFTRRYSVTVSNNTDLMHTMLPVAYYETAASVRVAQKTWLAPIVRESSPTTESWKQYFSQHPYW
jgi:hypothetical protein